MSKGEIKVVKLPKIKNVKIISSSSVGNISKVEAKNYKEEFLKYALSEAKERGLDIQNSFFDRRVLKIVSEERTTTMSGVLLGGGTGDYREKKAAKVSTGGIVPGIVHTSGGSDKPKTVKFINYFVEFNFDKALESIDEIAKTIKPKNSELEWIIYIISTVIWLRKASKVEISTEAAMVVDWLHRNGHHKIPCTEEAVIKGVLNDYKKEDGSSFPKDDIVAAITFLNKYFVIYIKDAKIRLVEKVKARK